MLTSILGSILGSVPGDHAKSEGEQGKGLAPLLIIGLILFALPAVRKLLQKPEDGDGK